MVVAAGLALGACGGSEGSDGSASIEGCDNAEAGTVSVGADDPFEFTAECYAAPAGRVMFDYTLVDGALAFHDLQIDGVDKEKFLLEVDQVARNENGSVDLEAGSYTLFCSVPTHREGGMEAPLTITA